MLQSLSVILLYFLAYTSATLVFPCIVLVLIYLCVPYPPVVAIPYIAWMWWDWDTPHNGGRARGYCSMQRSGLYRALRDYYPISLIKTADLSPDNSYIFAYHPHGMVPEGALVALGTEAAGFRELFTGMAPPRIAVDPILVRAPVFREIALSTGFTSVSRESCQAVLTNQDKGDSSIVICIGGRREVLNTASHTDYHLVLAKRKGFVRLALETGAALVPVFAFGQNDLFHQTLGDADLSSIESPWCLIHWRALIMKYVLLAFYDRSTYGILPRKTPINVVVGEAIEVKRNLFPTNEEIDDLHRRYIDQLLELFYKNREKYNNHDRNIVLV